MSTDRTTRTPRLTRRRTARLAVTVIAGAGVLLGGAGAASASGGGWLVDSNSDGVYDQYQYDVSGDGYVDFWFTDTDNDGLVDESAIDVDRDGWIDLWVVDRDHDGVSDASYRDTNWDGYPDTLLGGVAYDTVWGPNAPLSGPGVIGNGGGSSGSDILSVQVMNEASAQTIIDNWLAPACAASYNGC